MTLPVDEESDDRHRGLQTQTDDGQADESDEDADDLAPSRNLMQHERRDDDGERGLDLDDDRGQPGGQAERHGGVEKTELTGRHEGADEEDAAEGAAGKADEEDRRHHDEGEPGGDEEQRGPVAQAEIDEDEVDAPEHDDEEGEHVVDRAHDSSIPAMSSNFH